MTYLRGNSMYKRILPLLRNVYRSGKQYSTLSPLESKKSAISNPVLQSVGVKFKDLGHANDNLPSFFIYTLTPFDCFLVFEYFRVSPFAALPVSLSSSHLFLRSPSMLPVMSGILFLLNPCLLVLLHLFHDPVEFTGK